MNKIVETVISKNGLIIWVNDREYYLPYNEYPWFKKASVEDVFDVHLIGKEHLRWEALDIDLSIAILSNPKKYPLISK